MPSEVETIEVLPGTHKEAHHELLGPLPGRRIGNVIAYEMQAPATTLKSNSKAR